MKEVPLKELNIHLVVRDHVNDDSEGLVLQVPFSHSNLVKVCDLANELINCTHRVVDVLRNDPSKPSELLLLTKDFKYPPSHEGPHPDDMDQRPLFDVGHDESTDSGVLVDDDCRVQHYVKGKWLTEKEVQTRVF